MLYHEGETRCLHIGGPDSPDYNAVVKELQDEYPLRLWYFLDEVTTNELMRKIWRAILRSDLCIFDIIIIFRESNFPSFQTSICCFSRRI